MQAVTRPSRTGGVSAAAATALIIALAMAAAAGAGVNERSALTEQRATSTDSQAVRTLTAAFRAAARSLVEGDRCPQAVALAVEPLAIRPVESGVVRAAFATSPMVIEPLHVRLIDLPPPCC